MEIYVQLILLLALIKYCLKAAMTGRFWIIACYAALSAVIALALYPLVIEQPVSLIASLLENRSFVMDAAVLITLEAVAGIFISVFLLDCYFVPKEKRKKSVFIIKVLPGILFCVAIAYFELLFFKIRVGGEFMITAIIYALGVFFSILFLALVLKYFLQGESQKLELKILLNIAILGVGLLLHSSIADYSISHAQTTPEWAALGVLLGLVIVFFVIGVYLESHSKITTFRKTASIFSFAKLK